MVDRFLGRPHDFQWCTLGLAVLAVLGCGGAGDEGTDSARSTSPLAWRVTPRGIGPVRAGMSLAEASAAVGGTLSLPSDSAASRGCKYATWHGAPPGVWIMIEDGRVARVDIDSASVMTAEGIRVGDYETRVRSAYAGRLTETRHKYEPGGFYLTVTPSSPSDSSFRIVFETDGQSVLTYRAGRLPAVEYVERCG